MKRSIGALCVLAIAITGCAGSQPSATGQGRAAPAGKDPWPKSVQHDKAMYTVFQPQLDSWDGFTMAAHAAVSVQQSGSQTPVFGAVTFTAKTKVDRLARTVYLIDLTVQRASFPSAPASAATYHRAFQELFVKGPLTLALDRMEAALAVVNARTDAKSVAVRNPVPQFVFSSTPAVLVGIDGDPVWRPVAGTSYERVLNTRPLLLRDGSGTIYFHLFDGFLRAPRLAGPWTVVPAVSPGVDKVAADLGKSGAIDLMEGPPDEKTGNKPSLAAGVPKVIVATKPTELVVTNGPPDWVNLEGTGSLLYMENTDGNVFTVMDTQQHYILVSGRWFTSRELNGPWLYVAAKDLPSAFSEIPDGSPKENVKASLPGTVQAKEAIIATQIPQTADVDRATATFTLLQLPGAPDLRPIEGTSLKYVANSPIPVIQAPSGAWFALQKAVWFTGPALQGPWSVATSVPAEVYSIPPSSPIYYATYVTIYDVTASTVTVGYLPGYLGTYVADDTVVYGTGYEYPAYVDTAVWYGGPVTYGYAADLAWTPWTGWGMGFGTGWAYGAAWGTGAWGWGPAPYWGGYYGAFWGVDGAYGAWGPGSWAANSSNVYHQWGNTTAVTHSSAGYNAWTGRAWSGEAGHSYNSQTGQISAGQRGTVGNVYTGAYASGTRGATSNPTTGVSASGARGTVGNAYTGASTNVSHLNVSGPGGEELKTATVGNDHYADVNGNVYRNTGNGWEEHDSSGGWSRASGENLENDMHARDLGEQRAWASSGARGWGGGGRRR